MRAGVHMTTTASKGSAAPAFREKLPPKCPPGKAAPLAQQILVRFVGPGDVTDADFHSYAALGIPGCQAGKECDWASCSMFLKSITRAQLKELLKYPRLKEKTAVALIKVNNSTGVAYIRKTRHVDVWMFDSYDPMKHIQTVVEIDSYA